MCSARDWQVMQDYAFITSCMPEITPAEFRRRHTKDFLQMLHPDIDVSDEDIKCMNNTSVATVFEKAFYKKNLDQYYEKSGVALHHVLIATQTICVKCGCTSKPSPCDLNNILVYTSLGHEPNPGSVIPSRCTSRNCRHRANYGWDVFNKTIGKNRIFKPIKNRHCLTYWLCSTQTAFLTSMIRDEMLSQVLWNHAGSLNMANQGN